MATVGAIAGTYTYPQLQVDNYGRVTSISNQTPVTSWNGMTGAVTLSSANVTSALGFTPSTDTFAQAAFDKANTDYTTISATSGTYGSEAAIPVITLSANGRVSAITNTSISIPAGTSIVANSGQITANASTGTVALGLATTAVTPATYGTSTSIPSITVDEYGRITGVSNNSVSTTINLSGTTGTGSISGGDTLTFNSNNSVVISAQGSTLYVNTPQSLTTTSSPSFTAATLNTSAFLTSTSFTTGSVSQVAIDTFAKTTYRSAKYFVQMTSSTSYHVAEIIVLHDGTNTWITQYGDMWTSSSLGTFSADISGSNVRLLFTAANSTTTVKLNKTLLVV